MDALLKKFLPRIEFDSYEDFKANYTVNVPENFNFGFEMCIRDSLFTVNELMEQRLPVAAESIAAYNDAIFTLEEKKEQLL